MNTMENPHLNSTLLDRHLDGDLAGAEHATARTHLAGCPRCTRELRRHERLRADLGRLPLPEPPAMFDLRILEAVLPAPSEATVLLRLAARVYGASSAMLATVGAALLIGLGPEFVVRLLAEGLSRGIRGLIHGLGTLLSGMVSLIKVLGDLVRATDGLRGAARALETAALSLSPQIVLVAVLTMVLASLVLVWAVAPARERGVPHVCLSL